VPSGEFIMQHFLSNDNGMFNNIICTSRQFPFLMVDIKKGLGGINEYR
jgi:hypothetical protein